MERRKKEFQRNEKLEVLLSEINQDLEVAEEKLLLQEYESYPVVFIMGAPRSGSTLTMQWLANTGQFAYPTNLMSRFYNVPIIGAKIQKLLLDPEYSFRNEIVDFSKSVDYHSENGKTKGASSPNEFWYFWRRFFPFSDIDNDFLPDKVLEERVNYEKFYKELMGIANVMKKPIMLKGMIANYNIGFLDKIFPKAVFIYVKRDMETNVASILDARKRQLGSENLWYSFRIPEMQDLLQIKEPEVQVAGQVHCIWKAVEHGLESVSEERKLIFSYEEFCKDPSLYYRCLKQKLDAQGCSTDDTYIGEEKFNMTRKDVSNRIKDAYPTFLSRYANYLI